MSLVLKDNVFKNNVFKDNVFKDNVFKDDSRLSKHICKIIDVFCG